MSLNIEYVYTYALVFLCVQGISVDGVDSNKRFSGLKTITIFLYRLMKQTVKDNITNCMRLFPFMHTIQSHLGKGLSCMQVIYIPLFSLCVAVAPSATGSLTLHSYRRDMSSLW